MILRLIMRLQNLENGIMKSKRFNKTWIGFLIGVIAPVFGFLLYGWYWSWKFFRPFSYFVNDVFIRIPTFRSSIITLSLLINLVPFLIFMRTDRYQSAKGVMAGVFLYVPFVLYFYFF